VEGVLYKHPAVLEVCVVGVPDPVRVENVKAFVVLRKEYQGKITGEEFINWAKKIWPPIGTRVSLNLYHSFPKAVREKLIGGSCSNRKRKEHYRTNRPIGR